MPDRLANRPEEQSQAGRIVEQSQIPFAAIIDLIKREFEVTCFHLCPDNVRLAHWVLRLSCSPAGECEDCPEITVVHRDRVTAFLLAYRKAFYLEDAADLSVFDVEKLRV
jgi:hypothetical protein